MDKNFFDNLAKAMVIDDSILSDFRQSMLFKVAQGGIVGKAIESILENQSLNKSQKLAVICSLVVDMFPDRDDFVRHLDEAYSIKSKLKVVKEEKSEEGKIDIELKTIDDLIKKTVKTEHIDDIKQLIALFEEYKGTISPLVSVKEKLSKFKTESKKIEIITKFIKTLK